MKRLLMVIISLSFLMAGCMDVSMQYKPQADLAEKYDNHVKDEYITIYYTLKQGPEGQMLMTSVKNTGSIFMQNLSFNYDDCCQQLHKGPGSYNYKNIGNLKNRASKVMNLTLPKGDISSVKLQYSFTPVLEDAFLDRDASYNSVNRETISNNITIYFK